MWKFDLIFQHRNKKLTLIGQARNINILLNNQLTLTSSHFTIKTYTTTILEITIKAVFLKHTLPKLWDKNFEIYNSLPDTCKNVQHYKKSKSNALTEYILRMLFVLLTSRLWIVPPPPKMNWGIIGITLKEKKRKKKLFKYIFLNFPFVYLNCN